MFSDRLWWDRQLWLLCCSCLNPRTNWSAHRRIKYSKRRNLVPQVNDALQGAFVMTLTASLQEIWTWARDWGKTNRKQESRIYFLHDFSLKIRYGKNLSLHNRNSPKYVSLSTGIAKSNQMLKTIAPKNPPSFVITSFSRSHQYLRQILSIIGHRLVFSIGSFDSFRGSAKTFGLASRRLGTNVPNWTNEACQGEMEGQTPPHCVYCGYVSNFCWVFVPTPGLAPSDCARIDCAKWLCDGCNLAVSKLHLCISTL